MNYARILKGAPPGNNNAGGPHLGAAHAAYLDSTAKASAASVVARAASNYTRTKNTVESNRTAAITNTMAASAHTQASAHARSAGLPMEADFHLSKAYEHGDAAHEHTQRTLKTDLMSVLKGPPPSQSHPEAVQDLTGTKKKKVPPGPTELPQIDNTPIVAGAPVCVGSF